MTTPAAMIWNQDHLQLLDQRRLPGELVYLDYRSAESVAEAIRDMVVRGAPAIGISAAYAMAMAAGELAQASGPWQQRLAAARAALAASRPTAVNLFWALERCDALISKAGDSDLLPGQLLTLARQLHDEDIHLNTRIGDFGASLLPERSVVYTHCNAGALATGGYGTALGVIRSAHRDGKIDNVLAGETRPWLQGARLTSWELMQDGIPVSLAIEGAAAQLMREHKPSWVIIGADRIAANGDTANKIGSYNLAILARYHGVKFMVAAPTSSFDSRLEGPAIPIEQRPGHEISHSNGVAVAPTDCRVLNPAFDVTPAELIDAIVTEHGIIHRPDREKVLAHLASAAEHSL